MILQQELLNLSTKETNQPIGNLLDQGYMQQAAKSYDLSLKKNLNKQ